MIPNKSIKVLSITIAVILAVLLVLNALQDTDDCRGRQQLWLFYG